MIDLVWGILIIGLLSAMLLVGTLRVARSMSPRTANLLAILIVAMMLAEGLLLHDNIALTHILPVSNVIVLGNWSPLLVAAFAGIVWWRVPGSTLRRAVVIGAIVVACLFTIYRPILSKPPEVKDRWSRGVCLQTSRASCSAAAAATLLSEYKIPTTEKEMSIVCLTSSRGTSMLGLYRGLKLMTAGKGLDVYMFENGTIDDLRGMGPVLLTVELEEGAKVDLRYQSTWGWLPGVPHSVVVLGFPTADHALVADPATGAELWTLGDLSVLWHGVGVKLVHDK
jgi:hypothetical protein